MSSRARPRYGIIAYHSRSELAGRVIQKTIADRNPFKIAVAQRTFNFQLQRSQISRMHSWNKFIIRSMNRFRRRDRQGRWSVNLGWQLYRVLLLVLEYGRALPSSTAATIAWCSTKATATRLQLVMAVGALNTRKCHANGNVTNMKQRTENVD